MLSRWVPFIKPRFKPRDSRFKHQLVRNVLVTLLLTSLVPLLLVGTLNYFRAQELLRLQAISQLKNITEHQNRQINEYVNLHNAGIDRLVTNESFQKALSTLINSTADSPEHSQASVTISDLFRADPHISIANLYDNMMILLPDGTIAMATDANWAEGLGASVASNPTILSLIGANRSMFTYAPSDTYSNKLVLFSARSFASEDKKPQATLIALSTSQTTQNLMADTNSFFSDASSYVFTSEGNVIGLGQDGLLNPMPENKDLNQPLKSILGKQSKNAQFSAVAYHNTPVFAAAKWIAEYNIGVVLTVPKASIYAQNGFFNTFNIVVLALALVLAGALILFTTTHMVSPLVHLADVGEQFINGNWLERARINRKDEIGLLASAFNSMAGQLSELHESVDKVIEKKTSRLRIAMEIAQQATQTANYNDALGLTVALIADRFGYYHVAIYLLDPTGQALVLREASGIVSEQVKQSEDQAALDTNNVLGWAAVNRQARIVSNVKNDTLFRPNDLLPDTQSEMVIPIAIAGQTLGVLDIHSTLTDAFDAETVSLFRALANQISSTLQNTRLLETTQASFQETDLLYKATRSVTQARSEAEIIQALTDTFTQLPLVGALASLEGDHFKVLVVTDPKTGRVEKNLSELNIPVEPTARLLTENQVVLIDDIEQPTEYEHLVFFLLSRGCKSAGLVPVLENGRLTRILLLGAREVNQITTNTLQPYANLAEVMGATLDKFRVLGTLQKRLAELQILTNIGQVITAETNLGNLYRALHEQVMQTLGDDIEFGIAVYNEKTNEIQFPYFFESSQLISIPPFHLGEGLTSVLIQSRKPLLLANEKEIRSVQFIQVGAPPRSWMGVPLIFAQEVIGALILQDLKNENRFSTDDLNLFMALAPQIATSLRNAQLYTETQQALTAYDQERFLLNTLLANMPEGITFKDVQGHYIRASNSVAHMYNLPAEDLIGKTDFELMEPDLAENTAQEEQMALNLGEPQIGLIQHIVSKTGSENWAHISRIPIQTTTGEPYGLLIIQRDITELKQAEALAQRRAGQVLTAAEIARDTTGTLDVKTLLQKSVNLVRERFGYYHASIFLLDSAGDYAVLRESTGLAGQNMLEAGHRLAVGSKSIVGQVTGAGQPLIVNDVNVDPTHLPNPHLPDTRSELAIPLRIGDRVLGALDVQSTQVNAFNDEDVGVLEILADQLAVAVENGELFAKTQELLGKHRLLRQITVSASSNTNLEDALVSIVSGLRSAKVSERIAVFMLNDEGTLQVRASSGYEGTQHLEVRVALSQGITGQAAAEKRPIRVEDTLGDSRYINVDPDVRSELAIPILFGDELLGVLNLESLHVGAFDENDEEIMAALGYNLGGVIANIRLFNQVRQQVVRERQLFDVTSKIRRSVDLETILQTSARELARVLGARRARIEITAGNQALFEPADDAGAGRIGKPSSNGHEHRQEE